MEENKTTHYISPSGNVTVSQYYADEYINFFFSPTGSRLPPEVHVKSSFNIDIACRGPRKKNEHVEDGLAKQYGWISTSTHVANAYNRTIYANCQAEHFKPLEVERSLGINTPKGGGTLAFKEKGVVNECASGYSPIPPRSFQKFAVNCNRTNTVYVSIYYVEDNAIHWLCDSLCKEQDVSVMVRGDGHIVETVHGNIWRAR